MFILPVLEGPKRRQGWLWPQGGGDNVPRNRRLTASEGQLLPFLIVRHTCLPMDPISRAGWEWLFPLLTAWQDPIGHLTQNFVGNAFRGPLDTIIQSVWESWFCPLYISFLSPSRPQIHLNRLIFQSYSTQLFKRQMLNASDHPHAKAQRSAYIIWNKQKHNGYYKGDYPPRDHEFRIMQNRRRSILKSSQRKRRLNEAAMRNTISPNELKCPMQSPVGKNVLLSHWHDQLVGVDSECVYHYLWSILFA